MSKARDIADLVSAGNILADGAIATTEITGVTATASELNALDGITATATELNYTSGVTSAIQTQIDAKLSLSGGTMTGNLNFGDSDVANFGNSSDMQINHSFGSNLT